MRRSSRRTATSIRGCCSTTTRSPTRSSCWCGTTTTSRVCCTRAGCRSSNSATFVDPRETWQLFCENWHRFAGTASGYWLSSILAEQFGIDEQPDAANADALFTVIIRALAQPEFRPRALFERFGIEVLATTDDPLDDLEAHRALAADPAFGGRVIPTFRPDAYLDPEAPGFGERDRPPRRNLLCRLPRRPGRPARVLR